MSEPELKKWPDCPKWARASEGPGWIAVVIYGGGTIYFLIELYQQGRLHTLFESPNLGTKMFALGWGILFALIGVWLIVTVRRARRIMAEISARNRSEESQ